PLIPKLVEQGYQRRLTVAEYNVNLYRTRAEEGERFRHLIRYKQALDRALSEMDRDRRANRRDQRFKHLNLLDAIPAEPNSTFGNAQRPFEWLDLKRRTSGLDPV